MSRIPDGKDKQNKPVTARDWLGLSDVPDWAKARWVGAGVTVAICLLGAWVLLIAIGAMGAMTAAVFGGEVTDLRGISIFVTAVFGAPFLVWRTVIAARQADLQDEALFNDKINAAAEDLAKRRQVTRPSFKKSGKDEAEEILLEWEDDVVTRAAAIDRLLGLARERPLEVPRIAALLSVYVRELSKQKGLTPQDHDIPEGADEASVLRKWARDLKPIRSDMEKAVQTLGRLRWIAGQENLTIDLSDANLQGYDLQTLNFDAARMSGARIEGANLSLAQMKEANLRGAQMKEANLRGAQMEGADLSGAQMEGANLFGAQMEGANLFGAQMKGADLSLAEMKGADLRGAQMEGADLSGAQIDQSTRATKVTFRGAGVARVDWSSADLSTAHVAALFGDASVKLPVETPEWWPDVSLNWHFRSSASPWHIEFTHWQTNPDTYDWSQRRQHYTAEGEINEANPPPEYDP